MTSTCLVQSRTPLHAFVLVYSLYPASRGHTHNQIIVTSRQPATKFRFRTHLRPVHNDLLESDPIRFIYRARSGRGIKYGVIVDIRRCTWGLYRASTYFCSKRRSRRNVTQRLTTRRLDHTRTVIHFTFIRSVAVTIALTTGAQGVAVPSAHFSSQLEEPPAFPEHPLGFASCSMAENVSLKGTSP